MAQTSTDAVLAVDVGGTTIKGALVGRDGRFLREAARPTPVAEGPEAVAEAIERCAVELAVPGPEMVVHAVSVVVPGVIDVEAGRVAFAGNLGFRDVSLRDRVAAATGLPALLEHDVRAAGVAERTVGAARGVADHLVVAIGTGIAAVLVCGGVPVRGGRGIAGELGHIPVATGGERCACGQRGCLERYASASAIARRYAALGGERGVSAREVADRRDSDTAAERAWGEAVEALATGLVVCTMLLDTELIVLAGGLSEAGQALRAPLHSELSARIAWREPPALELSPLGGRAALVGAAVLAWQQLVPDEAVAVTSGNWYSPILR